MLRQQITGRVQLTDSDRKALAELGQKLGKQALEEMATVPSRTPFSPGIANV